MSSRPRRRAGAELLGLIALRVVVCAPGWVWAFTPPALYGHVTPGGGGTGGSY